MMGVTPRLKGTSAYVARLVELAYRARRQGLLAVERKVVKDLTQREESGPMPARVFEAAGGYAPTIGILVAVLGLIQVMQSLTDPSRLGTGVAVAFVAIIYGVASAKLLFLPIAHKLKLHHEHQLLRQEMLLEGVLALAQEEHPRLIAERLNGMISQDAAIDLKPLFPPK